MIPAKTSLRLAAAAAAGCVALWLALRHTDAGRIAAAVREAEPAWILAALASVVLTVAAGVLRWRLLFHPADARLRWRTLSATFVVGQTVNVLLPIRIGELVRAYLVSTTDGLPIGRVLGTIGVEKLFDLTTSALAAAWLLVFLALPHFLQGPGRGLVVTGAAALGVALLIAVTGGIFPARISTAVLRVVPDRLRPWVGSQITGAGEGLGALRRWEIGVPAWTLSGVILLLAASTNYLLFLAFHLGLAAGVSVLLIVALQVASAIVSVPGNLGVFQYVTVLVLQSYGVDDNRAAAYALTLYVIALVPKIAAGCLILALSPHRAQVNVFARRAAGGRPER